MVKDEPIGLIAGSRNLPLLFAQEARRLGAARVVAVAFEGETSEGLAGLVDDIVWLRVGQLSKMIRAFTDRGVRRCVMLGQIAPRNLFDVRPDLRAMGLLLRLKEKNAHSIFGGIADELARDGVEVVSAVPWLGRYMPGVGFSLGPALTAEQREDVSFGYRIAKAVSALEIGQTVVVQRGTVLAVEGFEGTDACLKRGGELSGKLRDGVAVKVAKERHDLRFDIPTMGVQTVETCADTGVRVLAVEAGRTLIAEPDGVERAARERKVAVVTVGGDWVERA